MGGGLHLQRQEGNWERPCRQPPLLLAHVQVRGGTPRCSCFDSVSGPHPAFLCGGLRRAQLFRRLCCGLLRMLNSFLLKNRLHLRLEGGIENGYPLISNSFFSFFLSFNLKFIPMSYGFNGNKLCFCFKSVFDVTKIV